MCCFVLDRQKKFYLEIKILFLEEETDSVICYEMSLCFEELCIDSVMRYERRFFLALWFPQKIASACCSVSAAVSYCFALAINEAIVLIDMFYAGHVKEDFTRNSNIPCISSGTMTSSVCRAGVLSFGIKKFLVL